VGIWNPDHLVTGKVFHILKNLEHGLLKFDTMPGSSYFCPNCEMLLEYVISIEKEYLH
jgi:hypothetical protein